MNRKQTAIVMVVVGLFAAAGWAVKPGEWAHRTEADFAASELKDAVVTSLGEVQLAREAREVAELEGENTVVYDLVRLDDDRIYMAVGPDGKLLSVSGAQVKAAPGVGRGDKADDAEDKADDEAAKAAKAKRDEEKAKRMVKAEPVAEFEGAQVFALAGSNEGLWVGISAEPSRLELRAGEKMEVKRTITLEGVRYVWDILLVGDRAYLATGTEGKVLALDLTKQAPAPVVVLDSKQDNVLCLGLGLEGRIYAGTDGEGLVYRIVRNAKGEYEPFIAYDAAEPEIGTLVVNERGVVYVGTADAAQARPGRMTAASKEKTGRPDAEPADVKKPEHPNIPEKPEPKEAEPKPDQPAKPDAPADKPAEPAPAPAPAPAPTAEPAPAPTAEQYDALRQEIRSRLETARQSGGKLEVKQAAPSTPSPAARSGPSRPAGPAPGGARAGAKGGNAIYQIDPDGFVAEVFRETVMILRMVPVGDKLLVATGNEGQLFLVDPAGEEVTIVGAIDAKQAPALLPLEEGQFLVGSANPGKLVRLATRFSDSGTLTSKVLDASQISLWGRLQIMGYVADRSSVEVQTRSGNVADPEQGNWSPWSAAHALDKPGDTAAYIEVTSPPARYLQYRLTLKSDGKASPRVLSVALKYLLPNLRPAIASVKTEYVDSKPRSGGGGSPEDTTPAAKNALKITWEASDENGDQLQYTLEARPFGEEAPYVAIAEKLTQNNYQWDTRTTPDGRYVLRVTASDVSDNVPDQIKTARRVTDPILVDNTPPTIDNVQVDRPDGKTVRIRAAADDALSEIVEVRYTVDSAGEWKFVLPDDLIYDSTSEQVTVIIRDLSPGAHLVTLRATDALGNSRYTARTISPAAAE